jgi:hypothetical protein
MADEQQQQVEFKSPTTGKVQAVPKEHWGEALDKGYRPQNHSVLYSPEGKRGMVENSQVKEKIAQGYQASPKTQFEKDRAPKPVGPNSPWYMQDDGQKPGEPFNIGKYLDSAQGKAMEKANVDTAKFGADAMMGTQLMGLIGKAFAPTVTKIPVPSGLFDAEGRPLMHEVEKLGKSAVGKGVKVATDWIDANPKKAFLIFELARELSLSPDKAMKMIHVIGK